MTTFTSISVHAVPLRKLLTGYIGKHTRDMEDTYLHFLQTVCRMASMPTIMSTPVIVLFKNTMCFCCATNDSSQQESPPARMQEGYHPPHSHSNFLLFWGGSLAKNFFPSLNMYQAKSGVKKFYLYWVGGVGPSTKIFFPV